jgi:acetyl esterase/lipase
VSAEQRETLDAILRQSAFPADSDVAEQRRLLAELLSAQPLPAGVTVTAADLGGVPTAEITIDGTEPRHVVLYFHGGVYVMGDAFQSAGLAAQIARRTRATVISVGYRLAPEHPYPAAVDDALAAYQALLQAGTAPSDIVLAGESAGGGLAVATMVNAREHGLPQPAAASCPLRRLTWPGPHLAADASRPAQPPSPSGPVPDCTAGHDPPRPHQPRLRRPIRPAALIIQAGTHGVLLDDAVRLARQAAAADVAVTLGITPRTARLPGLLPILDAAAQRWARRTTLSAHLTTAEHATA